MSDVPPADPQLPAPADGRFDLRLARHDRVITVLPDQTAIQALAAAGIEAPVSCEQGLCGTCVMRVLSGIPEHYDSFLSPEEQAANDCFTPCVSRSKTALLVVDF